MHISVKERGIEKERRSATVEKELCQNETATEARHCEGLQACDCRSSETPMLEQCVCQKERAQRFQ